MKNYIKNSDAAKLVNDMEKIRFYAKALNNEGLNILLLDYADNIYETVKPNLKKNFEMPESLEKDLELCKDFADLPFIKNQFIEK